MKTTALKPQGKLYSYLPCTNGSDLTIFLAITTGELGLKFVFWPGIRCHSFFEADEKRLATVYI